MVTYLMKRQACAMEELPESVVRFELTFYSRRVEISDSLVIKEKLNMGLTGVLLQCRAGLSSGDIESQNGGYGRIRHATHDGNH
jgi:hypothetical protein